MCAPTRVQINVSSQSENVAVEGHAALAEFCGIEQITCVCNGVNAVGILIAGVVLNALDGRTTVGHTGKAHVVVRGYNEESFGAEILIGVSGFILAGDGACVFSSNEGFILTDEDVDLACRCERTLGVNARAAELRGVGLACRIVSRTSKNEVGSYSGGRLRVAEELCHCRAARAGRVAERCALETAGLRCARTNRTDEGDVGDVSFVLGLCNHAARDLTGPAAHPDVHIDIHIVDGGRSVASVVGDTCDCANTVVAGGCVGDDKTVDELDVLDGSAVGFIDEATDFLPGGERRSVSVNACNVMTLTVEGTVETSHLPGRIGSRREGDGAACLRTGDGGSCTPARVEVDVGSQFEDVACALTGGCVDLRHEVHHILVVGDDVGRADLCSFVELGERLVNVEAEILCSHRCRRVGDKVVIPMPAVRTIGFLQTPVEGVTSVDSAGTPVNEVVLVASHVGSRNADGSDVEHIRNVNGCTRAVTRDDTRGGRT